MRIDQFLGLLEGVTPTGEGAWVACCPAHGDKHPSMSVTEKAGKILVHCHAGCTARDIVGSLGLKFVDLRTDKEWNGQRGPVTAKTDGMSVPGGEESLKKKPAKKSGDHGRLVCEYLYQDADGNTIYKAQRRVLEDGRKTFQMMHPDPESEYGWGYGLSGVGVKRVPYRLPEVIQAARKGCTVVIAEGEKDVDNIRALGFAATCNVGGAGKWGYDFPKGWGEWFKGARQILVIADNDAATKVVEKRVPGKKRKQKVEEAFLVGQKHAWSVRCALIEAGFAGKIKLMVMPAVGEAKAKDFTDWRDAWLEANPGGDVKGAFIEAVKDAGEWPGDWMFTPDPAAQAGGEAPAARVAPAEKGGRDSASDTPAGEAGEGQGGRFGRPVPRSPETKGRAYKVDYRVGGFNTVPLEVSKSGIWRVYKVASGGEEREERKWIDAPLSVIILIALKMTVDKAPKSTSKMLSDVSSAVAMMWLRSRGKFFWDENAKGFATSLYFDETTGVLMRVRSDEFMAFLATASEINRESSGFKYLMALIDDAAMSDEVSQGVIPSNMWDRRGDAVYVSTGDKEMYRLKGGAVELVQNGTDGVLFMRGKTLAPWKLSAGPGIDPFANAKIFMGASWADATGAMNVRLWVLNLFACHTTKPIMLVTGLAQSGKTRMAKSIKEILGVRVDGRLDLSVQQVEDGDKGLDAFWATVNDGKLEVFDNLDTKIKWVGDALQNVATDGQTKRRTLYTTFGVSVLKANANIILTSNNPMFSTEGNGGMADRIISINLRTNTAESMDNELTQDIVNNRDEYLTWIVRTVSAALADDKPVDKSINRRHPDYGIFSVRCGRAFGDENGVIEALGAAEADKCLLPLRNDAVTREIMIVFEEHGYSMRFTGGEMSQMILARMDEPDDKIRQIYSSRRVGKALSRFKRQFETLIRFMPARMLQGSTVYETNGLTELGRYIISKAEKVDKVDFDAEFARVRTGAGALWEFSQNAPKNPPNPPDAHGAPYARAPITSPSREEEDSSKSMESEAVMDEGSDDLEF